MEHRKEELYSQAIPAGKRRYFFDVKETRGGDKFITIAESRRIFDNNTGEFYIDKNKLFLYKEDFDKFREGLEEVIAYMKENLLKDVPEHTYETWKASEDQKTDVEFEDL